jgi:arylsulfatase A-like enzyme
MLLGLILAATVVVAFGCGTTSRSPGRCDDCNLLLIVLDTLRSDRLGCYGHDRPTSPNIDRLATRSLLFEQAYAVSPWTVPSHYALFTGRYPRDELVIKYGLYNEVSDAEVTLAERLRARGYRTAGFHGGGFVDGRLGFAQGFDLYQSNGRRIESNLDDIASFLDRARSEERPFFLFVHGFNAHRPYIPPAEVASAFVPAVPPACAGETFLDIAPSSSNTWSCLNSPGGLDYARALYDAEVAYADALVAAILDRLGDRIEETIVVLTSDHGEEFLEHGNMDHISHLHDELLRVPLIIRVPGSASGRVQRPVAAIDLLPTLTRALGIDEDDPRDLLAHQESKPIFALTAYTESWATRRRRGLTHTHHISVREDDWKVIVQWDRSGSTVAQLFDLEADAAERHDRIHDPQHRVRANRLSGLVQDWYDNLQVRSLADGPGQGGFDVKLKEQLQSLGYLDP